MVFLCFWLGLIAILGVRPSSILLLLLWDYFSAKIGEKFVCGHKNICFDCWYRRRLCKQHGFQLLKKMFIYAKLIDTSVLREQLFGVTSVNCLLQLTTLMMFIRKLPPLKAISNDLIKEVTKMFGFIYKLLEEMEDKHLVEV